MSVLVTKATINTRTAIRTAAKTLDASRAYRPYQVCQKMARRKTPPSVTNEGIGGGGATS